MAKTGTSIRYKAEEKRRNAIILAIILFILGLAMIFAGTYAYYRNTINGTVSGTIAAWSFKANNSATSFIISLSLSQSNSTYNSTIAPGTSGSFSIDLSAADSDLAADYVMTFSDFQNKPTNLKFYSDSSFTNETDITASGYSITGTLASGDATTKTIYWKWAYGAASSVTLDNQDADKNVSFTVTVVGTQHEA